MNNDDHFPSCGYIPPNRTHDSKYNEENSAANESGR